ncbi:MAG TPA: hypothetical protein VIM55_19420 [Mucilaginibacter sp.]
METTRNKPLLLNWIFITSLLILLINDQYLKWTFHNWITGKLSDFAGLLIFPMFLQFIFPPLSKTSALVTGLFFIFWKLPVSDDLIHLYNKIALIPITRTVDYTDLLALSILPLSHIIIQRVENFKINIPGRLSLNPLFLLIPAAFVFMATSPPVSFYMRPGGDIHIGRSYRMKMSKDKILAGLKARGYVVRPDTATQNPYARPERYFIENVVLNGGKDTIKSIEIGFLGSGDKPLFLLNNITLKTKPNLSDWRTLKRYSKLYDQMIRSEIIEEVK